MTKNERLTEQNKYHEEFLFDTRINDDPKPSLFSRLKRLLMTWLMSKPTDSAILEGSRTFFVERLISLSCTIYFLRSSKVNRHTTTAQNPNNKRKKHLITTTTVINIESFYKANALNQCRSNLYLIYFLVQCFFFFPIFPQLIV